MGRRKAEPEPEQELSVDERLAILRAARKQQGDAKKTAEEEKEALLDYVREMGSVPFLDEDGVKRIAYFSDSELTILDIDELQECVDEGLVSESVLELVAPREPDLDALKDAVAARRIPKEAARRCIRIERGRETIRFKDEGE